MNDDASSRVCDDDRAPQSRRPVVVHGLNLACCAVESEQGIRTWRPNGEQNELLDPLNVLVVAGTVARVNADRVKQEFDALPSPRAVVAFGACTISGGPYWDSYAVLPGIGELIPVDRFIAGCPPRPEDLQVVLDELAMSDVEHA